MFVLQRETAPYRKEFGAVLKDPKTPEEMHVSFKPNVDVKAGDILVDREGRELFVTKVRQKFYEGEPYEVRAYYQMEEESKGAQPCGAEDKNHAGEADKNPKKRLNRIGKIIAAVSAVIGFISAVITIQQGWPSFFLWLKDVFVCLFP